MATLIVPRREELAKVFTDQRTIKAIEALFSLSGTSSDEIDVLTVLTELIQQQADTSSAQIYSLNAQLDRIASALELIATAPRYEQPQQAQADIFGLDEIRESVASLTRRVSDIESKP